MAPSGTENRPTDPLAHHPERVVHNGEVALLARAADYIEYVGGLAWLLAPHSARSSPCPAFVAMADAWIARSRGQQASGGATRRRIVRSVVLI